MGRLIDADLFIRQIKKECPNPLNTLITCRQKLVQWINEQPTVDAIPCDEIRKRVLECQDGYEDRIAEYLKDMLIDHEKEVVWV